MGVYIKGMEMPPNCMLCPLCVEEADPANGEMCMVTGTLMSPCTRERLDNCPLVPVPPHGRLKKRLVYRGEVYNALEAERVKSLDGILTDPYKDGFHDGLKRALQILANEVDDAPTIIEAEESET